MPPSFRLLGKTLGGAGDRVVAERNPAALAQSITVPIRCLTRRAVSGFDNQIRERTFRTSGVEMSSTRLSPMIGMAYSVRVLIH